MNEEIFSRFLSNQCTEEELNILAQWLKKEGESLNSHIWFKQYWNQLETKTEIPELSGSNLLDRTHHQMNLKINTARELSGEPKEKFMIVLGKHLNRVAAILFIPLLLTSLVFYLQKRQQPVSEDMVEQKPVYQQITSPVGNKTMLELSDGSLVWLNHGSSLRFPLNFSGSERLVHLEGEAYFKVKSNGARPFIVRTDELQVTATGTEFNIMAYPDENSIVATLQTGKIELQKFSPSKGASPLLTLAPRQQARYSTDERKIEYADVEPLNYISWKEGKLVMMDDPLNKIARKLERWYNVEIDFSSEELGYIKYSGTFTNETLPQVLDMMKLVTPIEYTIYPRERKADGSYKLPHVLIRLKKGYQINTIQDDQ